LTIYIAGRRIFRILPQKDTILVEYQQYSTVIFRPERWKEARARVAKKSNTNLRAGPVGLLLIYDRNVHFFPDFGAVRRAILPPTTAPTKNDSTQQTPEQHFSSLIATSFAA
jgi:hypothetical protein